MGSRLFQTQLSALFAALCLVACSSDGTTSPGSTNGSTTGSGVGEGAPDTGGEGEAADHTTVTIDIWDRTFLPPGSVNGTVSIGLGQKVRWVNHDATPHTVTTVVVPAGGKPFNGYLASRADGGEYVFEPRVPGVWDYMCQFHPGLMSNGRIVVR